MYLHAYFLENPLSGRFFAHFAEVEKRVEAAFQQRDGAAGTRVPGIRTFRFASLANAVLAWFEALEAARKLLAWDLASEGPLPMQAILSEEARPMQDREGTLPFRGTLAPEEIRVSKSLQMDWQSGADKELIAAFQTADLDLGFFALTPLGDGPAGHLLLLPNVALALKAVQPEPCFYCGAWLHEPARCPSRHLGIEVNALETVGRFPMKRLDELLGQILLDLAPLFEQFEAGVTVLDIRKDEALQAAAAFFDANRVFQLRFLKNLASSHSQEWPGFEPKANSEAGRPARFNLALDSLRVGKYAQARLILADNVQAMDASPCLASVCSAFIALEDNSLEAMLLQLEEALSFADSTAELVYVNLLKSRCLEILGRVDEAVEAVAEIFMVRGDCQEGHYRRLQLAAKEGFMERQRYDLRRLCRGDHHLYMRALLDPELFREHAEVSGVCAVLYAEQRNRTAVAMEAVRKSYEKVEAWLPPHSAELKVYQERIQALAKESALAGYYDILGVDARGDALNGALGGVVKANIKKALGQLGEVQGKLAPLAGFWLKYPHQALFPLYGGALGEIGNLIADTRRRLETGAVRGKEEIDELLETTNGKLAELEAMQPRMRRTQAVMAFNRKFWRVLVVLEIIGLSLGILVLPLLGMFLPEGYLEALGLAVPLGSAQQARFLYMAGVVVCPTIALLWSLRALMKQEPE